MRLVCQKKEIHEDWSCFYGAILVGAEQDKFAAELLEELNRLID